MSPVHLALWSRSVTGAHVDAAVSVAASSPSAAAWARRQTPEERAAQLERESRLLTSDIRRAFWGTLAGCAFSALVALLMMGWAVHTTDASRGQVAFLGGLILGYAGIGVSLGRHYLTAERNGWL